MKTHTKAQAKKTLLESCVLSKIFYTIVKTRLDVNGFRRYQLTFTSAGHSELTEYIAVLLGLRFNKTTRVLYTPSHPRETINTLASILDLDVCTPIERQ